MKGYFLVIERPTYMESFKLHWALVYRGTALCEMLEPTRSYLVFVCMGSSRRISIPPLKGKYEYNPNIAALFATGSIYCDCCSLCIRSVMFSVTLPVAPTTQAFTLPYRFVAIPGQFGQRKCIMKFTQCLVVFPLSLL